LEEGLLILSLLGTISIVSAQEGIDQVGLEEAQGYLKNKEAKKALKHLDLLLESLACPNRVVNKQQLASIWVYRGYAYQLLNKDDQTILDAWDQAFAMNIGIVFDEEILPEAEHERDDVLNYFEARRRMVEGFGGLDLQIPENVGDAKLYIDGRHAAIGEVVQHGIHLAQIVCPKDSLQSRWSTFEEGFDWFALCPSGVDVSQTEEIDDLFFGMGGGSQVIDDVFNPDPICYEMETSSTFSFTLESPKGKGVAFLGAGGVLLVSGTATYYGMTVPRFAAVEVARNNPEDLTPSDASQITKDFNRARLLTLGLLGAGIASSGFGGYSMLQVMPNWIGISVQF